jgi:WD40 repeat protein
MLIETARTEVDDDDEIHHTNTGSELELLEEVAASSTVGINGGEKMKVINYSLLLHLPIEILIEIFSFLKLEDYVNFDSVFITCKLRLEWEKTRDTIVEIVYKVDFIQENRWAGHNDSINCILPLSNCYIASGSSDNTIKIWNVDTCHCEQTLIGHTLLVRYLAGLPDGRVVSGSSDETIKVWNLQTGECDLTISPFPTRIICVIALADGRIASGNGDGSIAIWNSISGDCELLLPGDGSAVFCMKELSDGRLAYGQYGDLIHLWNLQTLELQNTTSSHSGRVTNLIELHDGRILSGSTDIDRKIKLWDPHTRECVRTMKIDTSGGVFQLDEERLVAGSADCLIKIWNLTTGVAEQSIAGHQFWIRCLSLLEDGRIVSGSVDETIIVWRSLKSDSKRRIFVSNDVQRQ